MVKWDCEMIELLFVHKYFIYSILNFYYVPLSKLYSVIASFAVADRGKVKAAEWAAKLARTALIFGTGIIYNLVIILM